MRFVRGVKSRNSKGMIAKRRYRSGWCLGHLAALLLAGCAVPQKAPTQPTVLPQPTPPLAELQAYSVSPAIGTQCVPYARQRSGIGIFGDAYTWWDTAAGRFARGSLPMPDAVLVLAKTARLHYGHLAVVQRVVSAREIRIDHANWQPDALITGMSVIDVSPANDWTQLRFWNKEARVWGRIYPARGFIYNIADDITPPSAGGTMIISGNGSSDWPPQQPTP